MPLYDLINSRIEESESWVNLRINMDYYFENGDKEDGSEDTRFPNKYELFVATKYPTTHIKLLESKRLELFPEELDISPEKTRPFKQIGIWPHNIISFGRYEFTDPVYEVSSQNHRVSNLEILKHPDYQVFQNRDTVERYSIQQEIIVNLFPCPNLAWLASENPSFRTHATRRTIKKIDKFPKPKLRWKKQLT